MSERIDPELVHAVFLDCLFRPEEISGGTPPVNEAVMVEAVMFKLWLHRGRLESHRQEVRNWLGLLPDEFRKSGGGGWSFLQACVQASGEQWTGLHQRVDELLGLGVGLGLARWKLPREMWTLLPGGMPYVEIDDLSGANGEYSTAEPV